MGTDDRSDDGAGLDVVRELRARAALAAEILEAPTELTGLLDLWEGRSLVILVDATRSQAAPGAVQRWRGEELAHLPLPSNLSSHGLSLPDIVQLGRELGRNPDRLVVYGIEAKESGPGTVRSAPVQAAIAIACDRIAGEIAQEAVRHA